MYLSNIKLWNFRKFGNLGAIDFKKPHLDLNFTKGLNVLIGENDSGKTAILDAIKMVLKTHAYERMFLEEDDFFDGANELRIELLIAGLTVSEAAHFTEWLGWDKEHQDQPVLRLILTARFVDRHVIAYDVKGGMDDTFSSLDAQAKEYLKVTFLRPLRDAENELTAKKYSRLSQILEGHDLFKDGAEGKARFESIVDNANKELQKWFEDNNEEDGKPSNKNQIKDVIDSFLRDFIRTNSESEFKIAESRIRQILEKISLIVTGSKRPGLGTMNRLYMATELLHLQKPGWTGMRLCLVEEEEAHLHPQAQMKVLKRIQDESITQFIITTHSPNHASKVELKKEENQVVICKDGKVFPMGAKYTLLDKNDYKFLDNFLDVTKANLFFAKGIILVEGWAEEILLPAIAKKMGKDLTTHEVSIVNVGSTAYMRYAKLFMRQNQESMGCKVAIVTDLDVRPEDDGQFNQTDENTALSSITSEIDVTNYPDIKWCVAKRWTLEWCLLKSSLLGQLFKQAAASVHSGTFKNGTTLVGDAEFEEGVMNMLRQYKVENGKHVSVTKFKKVEVAYQLATLINATPAINFGNMTDDDYAKYLVDAINHACS